VFRCAANACGESFETLKYSVDEPETHVLGQGCEHLRVLFIKNTIFTHKTDIRHALYKKPSPEGDSYVAIYGAVHSGTSTDEAENRRWIAENRAATNRALAGSK
jgi:hypothetical protein